MKSRIDYHLEKWVIGSRYICSSPEAVHEALAKDHWVWTGTNQVNWTKTRLAPYYAVYWGGSAHLVAVKQSDSIGREFALVNSYWTENYDNWLFYAKWEDFSQYYTFVAFVDKEDSDSIALIEKRLNAWIKERGYSAIRQLVNKRRPDLTHQQKLQLRQKLVDM